MSENRLRVVVADDDPTVRDALADLLRSQDDLELVATAADHPGTIAAALGRDPDVILMDLRMPGGTAEQTIRTIRARAPHIGILALSAYEDGDAVLEALAAGGFGYLVKGTPGYEILEALHRAAREQLSISATLAIEVIRKLSSEIREHQRAEELLQISARQFHALFDRSPSAVVLIGPDGRIQLANERTREYFGYALRELVGQPPSILLPERYRDSDPTRVAAGAGMHLSVRRKDGTEFPAYIAVSMPQSKEQLMALFVRDTSDLSNAEKRYLQVVEAFPSPLLVVNPHGVITLLSGETEQLFGYERGELMGTQLTALFTDYPMEALRLPQSLPGSVTNATMYLTALHKSGDTFSINADIRPMEGEQWLISLSVPAEEAPESGRTQELTPSNGKQLRNLMANLIRGQEEERQRIATGIHDDTLQVVTAVALRVQQLRRRLEDPKDLDVLGRLDDTVQLAINRLRHLIFDLRPPLLERAGLVEALRSYLEQMRAEAGVRFTLHDQLTLEIPEAVRALVYRITHEALTNVRKHAKANHVIVELVEERNGIRVRIDDDGVGFDVESDGEKAGHLGLRSIRERATLAGGWAQVSSTEGIGSTVEFWIPTGDTAATPADSVRDAGGGLR